MIPVSLEDLLGPVNPPPSTPPALSPDQTFSLHLDRARSLPARDYPALDAFLRNALTSGLPPHQLEVLWSEAKQTSGYTLAVIRGAVTHLQGLIAAAAGGAGAGGPAPVAELFVKAQDKFYDRRSGSWLTKGALASALARDHGGDPNAALDAWLHGAAARCDVVDSVTYHPGLPSGITHDERGVAVFNTYTPSRLMPVTADVGPWLNLLDTLELHGGETVRERVLDELAWVVQHPGEKMNHGIVLGGAEGIGKDSFIAPWLSAIGTHNVKTVSGGALVGDFTSWLNGAKVAVINEVRFGGHRDKEALAEKLKPWLAGPPDYLEVNEKNLRPYYVPNLVQLVLMTNHRDALHVEQDTRRYFCVWCGHRFLLDGEGSEADLAYWRGYFGRYWNWLETGGGRAAVLAWLLARDVRHIDAGARPMQTQWLEEMIAHAREPLTAWLIDRIHEGAGIFEANHVVPEDVHSLINSGAADAWFRNGRVDYRVICRALATIGCVRERVWRDGGRVNAYRIRPDGTKGYPGAEHLSRSNVVPFKPPPRPPAGRIEDGVPSWL